MKQNPGVASALSFVFPGLGHVYALQTGKGIVIGLTWVAFNAANWYLTTRGLADQAFLSRVGAASMSTDFMWTIILSLGALMIWIGSIYDAKIVCEESVASSPAADAYVPRKETAATSQDQTGK